MNSDNSLVINKLPVPTWSWLKLNGASYEYDYDASSDFVPDVGEIPDGVTYVPRVSAQADAYINVETCCGKELAAQLFGSHAHPAFIVARKGADFAKPLVINFAPPDKSHIVSSQIIKAEEGASITVIDISSSARNASGNFVTRTICDAHTGANIHLIKVQLLGSGFSAVDDIGCVCGENAHIEVTQVLLGGKDVLTGAACALSSSGGVFKSDAAYLCADGQKLDMNYVVRHTGKKTKCEMQARGTLLAGSKKIYRGTIDFVKGCAGSTGTETEEVLLLSPETFNKSIPLILCGEENVAGDHAATIGRLGEDLLFYMQSRGLAKSACEEMAARAKISAVAAHIPDADTVLKIDNYLGEVFTDDAK